MVETFSEVFFLISGVDLMGPIIIKDGKTRNRALVKAYFAVFVCFVTKGIHLELLTELTTTSFV